MGEIDDDEPGLEVGSDDGDVRGRPIPVSVRGASANEAAERTNCLRSTAPSTPSRAAASLAPATDVWLVLRLPGGSCLLLEQ